MRPNGAVTGTARTTTGIRPPSIRPAHPAARAASSAVVRSCTSRGIAAFPSGPAGHRLITTTSSGFASSWTDLAAQVTLRDLLCHLTGLLRCDLLGDR